MASTDPGKPPFQWKGRDCGQDLTQGFRQAGDPEPYDGVTHSLASIAVYWINRRYTYESTDLGLEDLSDEPETITYSVWTDAKGTIYGYEVTVSGDPPFRLLSIDDLHSEPPWMQKTTDNFPPGVQRDDSKQFTLELFEIADSHESFFVDNGKVYALLLKTTRTAAQLYMGLYTGDHDIIRCPAPQLLGPPASKLHHWATIMDSTYHKVRTEPEDRNVMVQYRKVRVYAQLDRRTYGVVYSKFNAENCLAWGIYDLPDLPTDCTLQVGNQLRYELFVCLNDDKEDNKENDEADEGDEVNQEEEEEGDVIYLYEAAEDEWFRFHETCKSTVSHVRGELSMIEFSTNGRWHSVRTNFDHVSLQIYLPSLLPGKDC
jgi:hypothetical protein